MVGHCLNLPKKIRNSFQEPPVCLYSFWINPTRNRVLGKAGCSIKHWVHWFCVNLRSLCNGFGYVDPTVKIQAMCKFVSRLGSYFPQVDLQNCTLSKFRDKLVSLWHQFSQIRSQASWPFKWCISRFGWFPTCANKEVLFCLHLFVFKNLSAHERTNSPGFYRSESPWLAVLLFLC